MQENANDNPSSAVGPPVSVQRKAKVPATMVGLRILLSEAQLDT